ncbi:MAG: phosphotransferase, partial [Vicinamibacteria bacterium]
MISERSLAQPAAPVSIAEAARLARDVYGLLIEREGEGEGPGSVTALDGEYDANFRISAVGGRRFVLKVMHPGRQASLLELQCAALLHLAKTMPSLGLPRVQATLSGDLMAKTEVPLTGGEGAESRLVWLLTYVNGTPFTEVRPQTDNTLINLGRYLGDLDSGLESFVHPASDRNFKWNLAQAGWIAGSVERLTTAAHRSLVERALASFKSTVVPAMTDLRKSVIHGDANDFNVLVDAPSDGAPSASVSVIDFGDMHFGMTVAEVAVAATYALLGRRDPMAAACLVVRGYHETHPLDDREVSVIFPLILTRLAVSVTNSAIRKALKPDDPYVTVSEAPAWEALAALQHFSAPLAEAMFRKACGQHVLPR